MTPFEIHDIAKEAAREAVREVLIGLGVNTSDSGDMIKMQADFAHLRAWRESTEAVKRRGMLAIVTVLVTGGLGYISTLIWHAPK